MSNFIEKLGDNTTHETVPDFNGGKGYYYMKQMKSLQQKGTRLKHWPRKPRRTLQEKSFFSAVDIRLSRQNFTVGISFDKDGNRI